MTDYVLVRVPRRWVPDWLWRLACHFLPLARLLSVHDPIRCECPCHGVALRYCPTCEE